MWPTADPEMSSPVVLVRDRDRTHGNCLPKSPQPASEVRGGHLHAFDRGTGKNQAGHRCVWVGGRLAGCLVGVSVWVTELPLTYYISDLLTEPYDAIHPLEQACACVWVGVRVRVRVCV